MCCIVENICWFFWIKCDKIEIVRNSIDWSIFSYLNDVSSVFDDNSDILDIFPTTPFMQLHRNKNEINWKRPKISHQNQTFAFTFSHKQINKQTNWYAVCIQLHRVLNFLVDLEKIMKRTINDAKEFSSNQPRIGSFSTFFRVSASDNWNDVVYEVIPVNLHGLKRI